MNKKVVILFAPGPFGGAEKIILSSIKELGVSLWLIKELRNPTPCEIFENKCIDLNINYKVFESSTQLDFKIIKELKQEIKLLGISLIHSHGMKANFLTSFLPIKKIATQHGKTSHTFKTKFLELIEYTAIKRADKLICVSKAIYDQTKHHSKVLVENFLPKELPPKVYNEDSQVKLIVVGRLSPEKGVRDAILVIQKLDNVSLTIIGDGSEKELIKNLSKNDNNIHILGFKDDISKFLPEADALIIPSHREGLPMILIEATSMGLPIIASKVGGIPKFLDHNDLLFKARDLKEMREKILKFSNNQSYYNERAKEFSSKVKMNYSKENWLKKINEIYNSLL